MVSDSIVKNEFISRTVAAGLKELQTEQINILEGKRGDLMMHHFDVDALIKDVASRRMEVSGNGGGVMFSFKISRKLRYADIKRLGNAKVYNKPLWGIIFGSRDSVMTRLQYEFTEEIRNAITKELEEAKQSIIIKL